jgi:hypothetical protein
MCKFVCGEGKFCCPDEPAPLYLVRSAPPVHCPPSPVYAASSKGDASVAITEGGYSVMATMHKTVLLGGWGAPYAGCGASAFRD